MRKFLILLIIVLSCNSAASANGSLFWDSGGFSRLFNNSANGYVQFSNISNLIQRIKILGNNNVVLYDGLPVNGQILCLPPGNYRIQTWPDYRQGRRGSYMNYQYLPQASYRPANYSYATRYSNGYRYPAADYWSAGNYRPQPYRPPTHYYQQPTQYYHPPAGHPNPNYKHDNRYGTKNKNYKKYDKKHDKWHKKNDDHDHD